MRTEKEVWSRIAVLATLAERPYFESKEYCGSHSREEILQSACRWMEEKGYEPYMSEDEKRFLYTPIGKLDPDEATERTYLLEAVPPLLWSLGLLEAPNYYGPCGDWYADITHVGDPKHNMEAFVRKCKMRSRKEIYDQCETAMVWHWRAREADFRRQWDEDIRECIPRVFGSEYREYLEAFKLYECDQCVDITFEGEPVFTLSDSKQYRYSMCSQFRQHAFEWLLREDEDWDEISTDT